MSTNWILLRTVNFNDADLAVGATGATITLSKALLQLATEHRVEWEDCVVDVPTKFIGGAISALALDIGVSGLLERYAKDVDLFTAAGIFVGSSTSAVKPRLIETAPTDVVLTFAATGANLNALTQGKAHIYAKVGAMLHRPS